MLIAPRGWQALGATAAGAELVEATDVMAGDAVPAVTGPRASDEPACPKCGGRMWDNRATKRNPRAPDYKCRNRSCDGVVWPAKAPAAAAVPEEEEVPLLRTGTDDVPF